MSTRILLRLNPVTVSNGERLDAIVLITILQLAVVEMQQFAESRDQTVKRIEEAYA